MINEKTQTLKKVTKKPAPRVPLFFLTLLVVITVGPGLVWAQDADTLKLYQGDTVRVSAEKYSRIQDMGEIATKMRIPLHKTPLSVGVVTAKIFKEQNAHVLSDALKNISSVNIQSGLGTHDYFLIRGFESTSAGLVLMDGADEPDVSLFRFFGYGFYDLYNVEQVEVLKGPAAFLYGSNTISGAVNLARKQPVFHNFADLAISHSKFNSYRETIDVGFCNATVAFRLNGLWLATGFVRKHAHRSSYALNPVVIWKIDKRSSITLNLEYVHSDIKPDIGIPLYFPGENWQLPEVATITSYQSPFDNLNQEIFRFRLNYNNSINKSFTIRNKTYSTYLRGKSRFTLAHVPMRNAVGAWIVDRHMYSFNESQVYAGNQFEALWFYDTGMIKHNLLMGIDVARFGNVSDKRTTRLGALYLFYPRDNTFDFNDLTTNQYQIETNAWSLVVAPYLVDYISFSPKFQLFCGARFDIIDFHTDRQNSPFMFPGETLTSKPIPYSRTHKKFSPMVGFVIKDSEDLWFYTNAGRSFSQGLRIIDEPEISTQYEFGYKYKSRDNRVRTSAAIYQLQKENMGIPYQGPLQGDLHLPTGSQQSRGLELEMTAMVLPDWYSSVTYAFTEAELLNYRSLTVTKEIKYEIGDFSGNTPEFVPAHIFNIWTTKEFRNGFGLGFGIHYASNQYVSAVNDYQINGYFNYNASVFYRFQNWYLHLYIENLTKTESLTRGLGPYTVIPTNPFSISGSIDITL